MSSMGKLTFFLGLQVMQRDDGIFINQDKYVADILKKFNFSLVKTASTPIETNKALLKDEEAEDVDVYLYRSMIGSLMYLTAFRPDIMFAVCACARFQVTPKVLHLHAVKRIFRYLKGQPKLGLWYPRDSPFDLETFSDSDYARASLDRKSTTGGCQFLGKRLILWQCKKETVVANSITEAEYVAAANCCRQIHDWIWVLLGREDKTAEGFWNTAHSQTVNDVKQIHATVDGKTVVISESSVRSDLYFNDEDADEAVFKEWDDRVVRATTIAASLDAEQTSDPGAKNPGGVISFKTSQTWSCLETQGLAQLLGDPKAEKESQKIGKEAKGKNSRDETLQDCDFDELDDINNMVDDAMENVEGDVETHGRNSDKTEELNLSVRTEVFEDKRSAEKEGSREKGGSTAEQITTAGDINEMMTIDDTLVAIRSTRPRTTSVFMTLKKNQGEQHQYQQYKAKTKRLLKDCLKKIKHNVQARMDADALLAARLQEKEREKFSIDEQARFLVGHFRKEELYESGAKWIIDFVLMDSKKGGKKAESSKKEATSSKKRQKADPDDEKFFSMMLEDFDRQDLVDLHRLVNERSASRALEGYDLILWGDFKTMFKPSEEDDVWRNQQDWSLISWKLYETCGVHTLLMDEANFQNEMAYELIRFVKSQVQE
ncbi:hypothetical protein Tco_0103116 [Tanacetum coccineum]